MRLVILRYDLVRDKLFVGLNRLVAEFATNKAFDVENSVLRIDGGLILRGVANQAVAFVCPCDVRRCNTVTLIVSNDFDLAVLEDANARVSCAKIDTNNSAKRFSLIGGIYASNSCRKGNERRV